MKIKSPRDFLPGPLHVVPGIAFAWGATACRFGDSAQPGPGDSPYGLGPLLVALLTQTRESTPC